ncbi:MAG: DUF1934 domain-containing protein [Lachnospiraceae bacterium]
MTKEVLLTISGLHYDTYPGEEKQDENEPIEVITPATYYLKNGKHYVVYDEVVEGMPGTIKNMIRISEDGLLEISKSGLTSTRMVFERDRINMTPYETPYGELMVGVYTKKMQVDVSEENIDVKVSYALDINSEKVADCNIRMNIRANG